MGPGAPWAPKKILKMGGGNDKHFSRGWAQRSETSVFCVLGADFQFFRSIFEFFDFIAIVQ